MIQKAIIFFLHRLLSGSLVLASFKDSQTKIIPLRSYNLFSQQQNTILYNLLSYTELPKKFASFSKNLNYHKMDKSYHVTYTG
jgi:hypothetical protein